MIDHWAFEGHAMYSPSNYKYRPFDAVLPWLLRTCGVDVVVHQFYGVDPKLQKQRAELDGKARNAGIDIDTCRKLWRGGGGEGEGGEELLAWEGLGYGHCSESGSCRGIPG